MNRSQHKMSLQGAPGQALPRAPRPPRLLLARSLSSNPRARNRQRQGQLPALQCPAGLQAALRLSAKTITRPTEFVPSTALPCASGCQTVECGASASNAPSCTPLTNFQGSGAAASRAWRRGGDASGGSGRRFPIMAVRAQARVQDHRGGRAAGLRSGAQARREPHSRRSLHTQHSSRRSQASSRRHICSRQGS